MFLLAILLAAVLALAPSPAAEAQDEAFVGEVEIEGDVLYAAVDLGSDTELKVYDVSVPGDPSEVGALLLPDLAQARHMVVADGMAYIHTVPDHLLLVIDVSNPANPAVVEQDKEAHAIAARGRTVYVDEFGETLVIYRVDDAGHTQFVSRTDIPESSPNASSPEESMEEDGLVLDWPYVYMPVLDTFNVSDPANPEYIGDPIDQIGNDPHWSVEDGIFYHVSSCSHVLPACKIRLDYEPVWGDWNTRSTLETGVWDNFGFVTFEMAQDYLVFVAGQHLFVVRVHGIGEGPLVLMRHEEIGAFDMAYHAGQERVYYFEWESLNLSTLNLSFSDVHFPVAPVE